MREIEWSSSGHGMRDGMVKLWTRDESDRMVKLWTRDERDIMVKL